MPAKPASPTRAKAGAPSARAPRAAQTPKTPRPASSARPARTAKAIDAEPPAVVEPSRRVLRQFRIVFNAVKSHFQQVEKRAGVGGTQVWALSIVRDRPGLGVNALAQAMDVRQPTASNLVRSLVEQDLLDVRREGPDRREVQLHLKPAAHQVLRRAPGPFVGVLPQALDSLDAQTLERLEADLAVLIERLGADRSGAGVPLGHLLRTTG